MILVVTTTTKKHVRNNASNVIQTVNESFTKLGGQ